MSHLSSEGGGWKGFARSKPLPSSFIRGELKGEVENNLVTLLLIRLAFSSEARGRPLLPALPTPRQIFPFECQL